MVSKLGRVLLLACSGKRPGMLLNLVQYKGKPPTVELPTPKSSGTKDEKASTSPNAKKM